MEFKHSSFGAWVLVLTRTVLLFAMAWKGHDQDLKVALYHLVELLGAGRGILLGEGGKVSLSVEEVVGYCLLLGVFFSQ